jgi:hypothetical protein
LPARKLNTIESAQQRITAAALNTAMVVLCWMGRPFFVRAADVARNSPLKTIFEAQHESQTVV